MLIKVPLWVKWFNRGITKILTVYNIIFKSERYVHDYLTRYYLTS